MDTDVEVADDPMHLFLSESGYFKKIPPASLRMNAEQKLKENDQIRCHVETTNRAELIFLTNHQQAYKAKVSSFDICKASVLGDYIPAKLGFDEGEYVVDMLVTQDYSGQLLFVYENGKAAKIAMNAYETKTNRKRLSKAFSDKSPLIAVLAMPEDGAVLMRSSGNRAVLFDTSLIAAKAARDSQGVQVMTLKAKQTVVEAVTVASEQEEGLKKYRVKSIPAAGALAKEMPDVGQMTL